MHASYSDQALHEESSVEWKADVVGRRRSVAFIDVEALEPRACARTGFHILEAGHLIAVHYVAHLRGLAGTLWFVSDAVCGF